MNSEPRLAEAVAGPDPDEAAAPNNDPDNGARAERPEGRWRSILTRRVLIRAVVAAALLAAALSLLALRNDMLAKQHAIETQLLQLEDLSTRNNSVLDEARVSLQQERAEREALASDLKSLQARFNEGRSAWALAETEYLLALANRRLQMEKDVRSAVTALEAADVRLRKGNDPALLHVRAEIARELQQLRAVPAPDISGMALELSAIIAAVDHLPIGSGRNTAAEGGTGSARPAVTSFSTFLAALWFDIRQLVVIRHADPGVVPISAPEQRFFLAQNLRLKLESARLALLRQDQGLFRASTTEASQWVERYFAPESKEVQSVHDSLLRLAAAEIDPSLPDLSASLHALQSALGGRPASMAGGGSK